MPDVNEETITDAVCQRVNSGSPRTQEIITGLVKHLHAFIREVEPSDEEWMSGIDFLTRTGKMCTDQRQEFLLLSDMLGATTLVDAINHRAEEGATASTVLGPFHSERSVELENGSIIANGPEWDRLGHTVVSGRVLTSDGNPISGATLDVWQADDAGSYDLQDDQQPDINLRGIFTTDGNGAYWFKTIRPSEYPVPVDGPGGELLKATGRHPMRPAHIHFIAEARGFKRLVSHIFVAGDQYLASDAAFGVKDSLIAEFVEVDSKEKAGQLGLSNPFYEVEFDIVLEPA